MLLLSPGNVNDIAFAPALIAAAGPIRCLIADKAYDANSLRQLLADQGAKAVIPSTMSRRQPIPYNKAIYRQRNLIERMSIQCGSRAVTIADLFKDILKIMPARGCWN